MARKKKQYTPWAVADKTGELYVDVKALMHPLTPYIDGLSITFFGKNDGPYLKIDDAIEWVRKEYESNAAYKKANPKALEALLDGKRKFEAGEIQEQ